MENFRTGAVPAAPNLINISVDRNNGGELSGRIWHCYRKEPQKFENIIELLRFMDELYDAICFPQSAVRLRNFVKPKRRGMENGEKRPQKARTKILTKEEVLSQRGACATFCVYVQYRQNATWQGSISWIEYGRTMKFRSALELLMLIDNALSALAEAERQ